MREIKFRAWDIFDIFTIFLSYPQEILCAKNTLPATIVAKK